MTPIGLDDGKCQYALTALVPAPLRTVFCGDHGAEALNVAVTCAGANKESTPERRSRGR